MQEGRSFEEMLRQRYAEKRDWVEESMHPGYDVGSIRVKDVIFDKAHAMSKTQGDTALAQEQEQEQEEEKEQQVSALPEEEQPVIYSDLAFSRKV